MSVPEYFTYNLKGFVSPKISVEKGLTLVLGSVDRARDGLRAKSDFLKTIYSSAKPKPLI
jgi:hypothetical protein